jgi:predicted nucleic acid-binding protein
MVRRQARIRVAIDTNAFLRSFKARSKTNPNRRLIRLWFVERRLQLVVGSEVLTEYLEIFDRVLRMDPTLIEQWRLRFQEDRRSTWVRLGRRYSEC